MDAKNRENGMSIAKTIADQIGGRAFYMMGAKNLVDTGKGLDFKVGRNAGKVTHVSIKLTDADLYDVEFIRCNMRAKEMRKVLASTEGAYADMLHDLIKDATGFALSL